jgi:hypothetical protein
MITNEIRDKLRDLKRGLYDSYETATSFEAYLDLMANLDNRYTEVGEVIPPDLIRNAEVRDVELGPIQLSLPFDSDAETDTVEIL